MQEIGQKIRHKRIKIKSDAELKFQIETKTGTRFDPQIENVSLTGLGFVIPGNAPETEGLDLGDIIPASKISWEGHEYALGRLAIQAVKPGKEMTFYGVSTIDSKVPLTGHLSRFFETDGAEVNPFEFEMSPDHFNIATFSKASSNSSDLFSRCQQYASFFRKWEEKKRFLYKTVRTASQGPRVNLTQRRKNGRHDYIVMGSNDYLGLASHPKVVEAAQKALKEYGFGSTGSPLTTGTTDIHEELKSLVASTFQKESALLFNSGYAANVGAIPGITSDQDLIVADFLSHASIQDGIQMGNATSRFFKHNNMPHLKKILKETRQDHAGTLLITEGIFSMDGDYPDLRQFVEIAREFNCRTYVDEAHSFGVSGPGGLGTCAKYGVLKDVDIIMGTFSKICGGIGGFIAASREVIDWYFWIARAHVFTVSIPPSSAAAMLQSMRLFLEEKSLVEDLQRNIKHFVDGMIQLGAPLNPHHESAVVPVVVGDEQKLETISEVLMDAGIQSIPIVYPAVSRKGARFRFTVMSNHTISDLDYVLNVFETAMERAKFEFPKNEEKTIDLSSEIRVA